MISHVEVEVGSIKVSPLTHTLVWCSGDIQTWQNSEIFERLKGAFSETGGCTLPLLEEAFYAHSPLSLEV